MKFTCLGYQNNFFKKSLQILPMNAGLLMLSSLMYKIILCSSINPFVHDEALTECFRHTVRQWLSNYFKKGSYVRFVDEKEPDKSEIVFVEVFPKHYTLIIYVREKGHGEKTVKKFKFSSPLESTDDEMLKSVSYQILRETQSSSFKVFFSFYKSRSEYESNKYDLRLEHNELFKDAFNELFRRRISVRFFPYDLIRKQSRKAPEDDLCCFDAMSLLKGENDYIFFANNDRLREVKIMIERALFDYRDSLKIFYEQNYGLYELWVDDYLALSALRYFSDYESPQLEGMILSDNFNLFDISLSYILHSVGFSTVLETTISSAPSTELNPLISKFKKIELDSPELQSFSDFHDRRSLSEAIMLFLKLVSDDEKLRIRDRTIMKSNRNVAFVVQLYKLFTKDLDLLVNIIRLSNHSSEINSVKIFPEILHRNITYWNFWIKALFNGQKIHDRLDELDELNNIESMQNYILEAIKTSSNEDSIPSYIKELKN